MIVSLLSRAARLLAGIIFIAAFAYPMVALVLACVTAAEDPTAPWAPSGRQWGLLGRSCWLAAAATLACITVALPAALVVAHHARGIGQALFTAAALGCLLCPPMVYSFGWDRLLPAGVHPHLRCIAVWAMWAWPIPAWLIAAGWRRGGRQAYEAALLDAPQVRALIVAARPALLRYVVLSAFVLFVLFVCDYGVPHACGLIVYATELLSWASNSPQPADAVLPALPVLALTTGMLAMVAMLYRRSAIQEAGDIESAGGAVAAATVIAWVVLLLGSALPMGALAARLSAWSAVPAAWRTYNLDLVWSFSVAASAGVVSVVMGWCLLSWTLLCRAGVGISVLFGALPGAVTGAALVAAYNRPAFALVYDHWPIVLLSYVTHYGWVGMLAAAAAAPWRRSEVIRQAQLDGADAAAALDRVVLPLHWPVLLAGAGMVAVLSLGDVAACSLVRVPGYAPLAHVLIEKFHRFEDDMLISLSLTVVFAAGVTALLCTCLLRIWRSRPLRDAT